LLFPLFPTQSLTSAPRRMPDRSGIHQLTSFRDELTSLIDGIIASDDSLPSLNSLDSPVLPPSPSIVLAIAATKELLALLEGSAAVFEKALSVRFSLLVPSTETTLTFFSLPPQPVPRPLGSATRRQRSCRRDASRGLCGGQELPHRRRDRQVEQR
jgi:hypothetical protein